MPRFIYILLALSLCVTGATAQKPKQLREKIKEHVAQKYEQMRPKLDSLAERGKVVQGKVDSVLDIKEAKLSFDPNYIRRPKEKWMFKGRFNAFGAHLESRGKALGGEDTRLELNSNMKSTFNLGVCYRGIAIGLGVNPGYLLGLESDLEINLNSYSNRYGYDLIFQSARTYKGTATHGETTYKLEKGLVKQNMLTATAYYVFNYKRFSYPAAFSQTYEQVHSCGSWLAGASFLAGNVYAPRGTGEVNTHSTRISFGTIGLGGGYAYNLVTKKRWLFHLSSMPTIAILSHNHIKYGGERENMAYRFPDIIVTGRGAVIHNFDRYFAGGTFVVNTTVLGDRDKVEMRYTKWQAHLIFGIRL